MNTRGDEVEFAIPRLNGDIEGTGGVLKQECEDFRVEEVPAYAPSGRGEHLYLEIEKTDMTGDEAVRRLARAFGVSPAKVGTAGKKDRRAVTKQWMSIHVPGELRHMPDPGEGIRILDVSRHGNRLRTGHLRGNRFSIRVRGTREGALDDARRILRRIESRGIPNYFGLQRFGRDGETGRWGLALLAGREGDVPRKVIGRKPLRKLVLSAGQSAVYNRYLSRRIERGLWGRVMSGDVLGKTDTGGLFVAERARLETEQERMDRGEIVHMGPMVGKKTFRAADEAAAFEAAIVEESGVDPSVFGRWGKLLPGTRRRDIVRPDGVEIDADGPDLVLGFTLPAGSYATVLLGEIMGGRGPRRCASPSPRRASRAGDGSRAR